MEEKLHKLAEKHQIPPGLINEAIQWEKKQVVLQKRKIKPLLKIIGRHVESHH
jgi:hypothetical protein